MKLRGHNFLGTTQSLCPTCMALVPAKILDRGGRIYFRKRCPRCGVREDFVCSDASAYDQLEYTVPGKIPALFGAAPDRGCPYDCGLCDEHEQHTCIGLVEITDDCNLKCPTCYASSGPGGSHRSFAEVAQAIDRLVEVEGGAEVLQLSGGEPTVHPELERILDYAMTRDIAHVMVNTNGLRLAEDDALLDRLAHYEKRFELYFQLDTFEPAASRTLRGGDLVEQKLRAIERLGRWNIRATLVCTLERDVNDHEIGDIVRFAIDRPHLTGVSFQPATYSGRHRDVDLERRVTFPDVVGAIEAQTRGVLRTSDLMPLPCAHPNCHTIGYAYRKNGELVPLLRLIDAGRHLDLLANGITFNRARGRELVRDYLSRVGCDDGRCDDPTFFEPLIRSLAESAESPELAREFFTRALTEDLGQEDVFRVAITSFLDPYNFDVRRLMKCCIHHVLPSGHLVPFCAYNVLYRPGHVALPALRGRGPALTELRLHR